MSMTKEGFLTWKPKMLKKFETDPNGFTRLTSEDLKTLRRSAGLDPQIASIPKELRGRAVAVPNAALANLVSKVDPELIEVEVMP